MGDSLSYLDNLLVYQIVTQVTILQSKVKGLHHSQLILEWSWFFP